MKAPVPKQASLPPQAIDMRASPWRAAAPSMNPWNAPSPSARPAIAAPVKCKCMLTVASRVVIEASAARTLAASAMSASMAMAPTLVSPFASMQWAPGSREIRASRGSTRS